MRDGLRMLNQIVFALTLLAFYFNHSGCETHIPSVKMDRYKLYSQGEIFNGTFPSVNAHSRLYCARICVAESWCTAFSYRATSGACALSAVLPDVSNIVDDVSGRVYYDPEVDVTSEATSNCSDPGYIAQATNFNPCSPANRLEIKVAMHLASNRLLLIYGDGSFTSCLSYDNLRHEKTTNCNPAQTLAGHNDLDPDGVFVTSLPDAASGYVHSTASQSVYFFFKGSIVYCYKHKSSAPYVQACTGSETPNGWKNKSISAMFTASVPGDLDTAIGSWMNDNPKKIYLIKKDVIYTTQITSVTNTDVIITYMTSDPRASFSLFTLPCGAASIALGQNPDQYYYFREDKFYEVHTGSLMYHGIPCKVKEWI